MPADLPSPDLSVLDPAACPLLCKYGGADGVRLVEQFNAAADGVRRLREDRLIGPALAADRFRGVLGLLDRVRGRMTRTKYVVGCIGITQAGKSTMVNNILGEEVCKPGAMDATSSLPCRIAKADRPALGLEFLTPALVADRRQKLCEAIGLPTPGDDRDLLPLLDRPDQFRLDDGQEPPRLKDDLRYLKEFLAASARGGRLLTDPPRVETDLPYESRYDYTTHGRGPAATEVPLLREARFRVANPRLPDDVELCDLPGLDSKRTIDDVVTWEYLPDLDGTFLFVNAGGNLLTEGMLKILSRLNAAFHGRVAGRAWVIFNKMDSLTEHAFRSRGEENVFGTFARFLDKIGVPERQVCFGSKKIWDAATKSRGKADPAFAAQTMSQSAAAPVPEACPPGLRPGWMELLKDGGVSLIRRLMFEDIATALAAQIRDDVGRLLGEFTREFDGRVAAERKRAAMNQGDIDAAQTCYYTVLSLRADVTTKPEEFRAAQEMERVRQSLAGLFDTQATPEVLALLSPAELANQFRTHGRVFDRKLDAELAGDLLERVYDEVGKRLENLPPVPVGPTRQGCQEAWRQFTLEDRGEDAWLAARPRFAGGELADWLSHAAAGGLGGEAYVGLMREKIDVAVRQTAHLVRTRLRHRLSQLVHELSLLSGEPDADAA